VAVVWWSQLYAWLDSQPEWTQIRAEAQRSMWRSPDHDILVLLPHSDEPTGVVPDAHLHHIAALAGIDELQLVAECRGEILV
jgi:hypothetical protein